MNIIFLEQNFQGLSATSHLCKCFTNSTTFEYSKIYCDNSQISNVLLISVSEKIHEVCVNINDVLTAHIIWLQR